MNKLVVVTAFAVVALAAQSAAACDWNREASAQSPAIATAAPPATAEQTAQTAVPQPSNAAAQEATRTPVDVSAPVVLVSDRR